MNDTNNDQEDNNVDTIKDDSANGSNMANDFNINAIIDTAKQIILNPVGFYKSMPTAGGLTTPLIFVAVMCAIAALISFVLNLVGLAKFGPIGGGGILKVIIFPIIAVVASFIGAGIMYVIWKLMGSDKDYQTAYQCLAYTSVVFPIAAVISIFPYLGSIAQTLISSFLLYLASIHVHAIKPQTAKIVFGVLAAIFVITGIQAERAARYWDGQLQVFQEQVEQVEKSYEEGSLGEALERLENAEDLTPEEAGRQAGEILKGLEQFAKGLEESLEEEKQDEGE